MIAKFLTLLGPAPEHAARCCLVIKLKLKLLSHFCISNASNKMVSLPSQFYPEMTINAIL